jgi:chromosome segregation ATPase
MKTLFVLLVLISCGKPKPQQIVVHHYNYVDNPYDNWDNEQRLTELENGVSAIHKAMEQNLEDLALMSQKLAMKTTELEELKNSGEATEEELAEAMSTLLSLGDLIAQIHASMAEQQAEIDRLKQEMEQ